MFDGFPGGNGEDVCAFGVGMNAVEIVFGIDGEGVVKVDDGQV